MLCQWYRGCGYNTPGAITATHISEFATPWRLFWTVNLLTGNGCLYCPYSSESCPLDSRRKLPCATATVLDLAWSVGFAAAGSFGPLHFDVMQQGPKACVCNLVFLSRYRDLKHCEVNVIFEFLIVSMDNSAVVGR